MAKKILIAVVSGVIILLVLIFALIMLLYNRAFFGDIITWLLCACIGVLAIFVIYLVINRVVEVVKKKDHDEDEISEHHIERFLKDTDSKQLTPEEMAEIRQANLRIAAQNTGQIFTEASSEVPTAPLPQEEPEKLDVEAAAKKEEEHRRRLVEAEARARQAAAAEQAARERAAREAQENSNSAAFAEAEALKRATEEAEKRLETERAAHREAEKEMDTKKRKEVENVRKQAEAAAAARRRAAQMAARSQSFPAIKPENLPKFNSQIIERAAGVADSRSVGFATGQENPGRVRYASEPVPFEASGTDSIWDRMEVRQSAAPILGTTPEPRQRQAEARRTGDVSAAPPEAPPPSRREETPPRPESRRATRPAEQTFQVEAEETYTTRQTAYSTGSFDVESPQNRYPHQRSASSNVPPPPVPREYSSRRPAPSFHLEKEEDRPVQRRSSSSFRLEGEQHVVEADENGVPTTTSGWKYAPAKPPKAWNTRRIPGDMSSLGSMNPEADGQPASRSTTQRQSTRSTTRSADEATEAVKRAVKKTEAGSKAAEAEKAIQKAADARRVAETKTGASAAKPATTAPGGEEVKRPRGRPPKPKTEEELNAPKRPRGRPPKPKTEEELNAPKRPRGRPPKPKTEEELNAPKRPRGRPRKNPLPEDAPAAASSPENETKQS